MECEKLNQINYNKILEEGNETLQRAIKSTNMSQKYKLFKEANIIKKIAKELQKWETMTRGY